MKWPPYKSIFISTNLLYCVLKFAFVCSSVYIQSENRRAAIIAVIVVAYANYWNAEICVCRRAERRNANSSNYRQFLLQPLSFLSLFHSRSKGKCGTFCDRAQIWMFLRVALRR